jgi:hypothetical protein
VIVLVHVVWLEVNLSPLHDDIVHVSGLNEEDTGVLELGAVSQVNVMHRQCCLVRMIADSDFSFKCVNRMACLSAILGRS